MNFDYLVTRVVGAQIDIEDIGNVSIRGYADMGNEYYLVIKTDLGWVEVFEYGPIEPDLQELPKSVKYPYDRFESSEYKLEKSIDKFLNNPNSMITIAEIIDNDTAKDNMRNISNYI